MVAPHVLHQQLAQDGPLSLRGGRVVADHEPAQGVRVGPAGEGPQAFPERRLEKIRPGFGECAKNGVAGLLAAAECGGVDVDLAVPVHRSRSWVVP